MNIAAALKSEITRLSRKESRSETQPLKKSSAAYRADIAALKRRVEALERILSKLSKQKGREPVLPPLNDDTAIRFSPKGLAATRKRLGLSAHEIGLLVGTSGQSIYNWENGSNRPRRKQIEAIAQLRRLGKRQAAERLAALRDSSGESA